MARCDLPVAITKIEQDSRSRLGPAHQSAVQGLGYVQFLADMVGMKMIDREPRMLERHIKEAKVSRLNTLRHIVYCFYLIMTCKLCVRETGSPLAFIRK